MAKAHSFIPKHDPQFFPEQNGADSRGAPADRFTVASPNAETANENQPRNGATEAAANHAVWNRYKSSGSAMFDKPDLDAKNVHASSRWWVRGAVAAFFIAGVAIAVGTYDGRNPTEPAAVEDSASAAAPAIGNPREASVTPSLNGGASGATEPVTPSMAEPPVAKQATAEPVTAKAAPVAKSPVRPAVKASAQPDPADAAAQPTYNSGAPASGAAPAATSPANPTSALPPIMPESAAPNAPAASAPAPLEPSASAPGPMPGSASTVPEITPGNEPTPE